MAVGDLEPLLGTWELLSFSARLENGRSVQPWGPKPQGRIVYDEEGNVTALLMHGLRNEADGRQSPADLKGEFSAYFGTFRVDAKRRVITHRVVASLSAARASKELHRAYDLKDGLFVLSFPTTRHGEAATNLLTWKRIAPPHPAGADAPSRAGLDTGSGGRRRGDRAGPADARRDHGDRDQGGASGGIPPRRSARRAPDARGAEAAAEDPKDRAPGGRAST